MKRQLQILLLGSAIMLAASGPVAAMSTFVSMSLKPLWPTTTEPGCSVLYEVTVEREGQGFLEVVLTADGLPEGAVVSFTQNPVRFTGRQTTIHTFIMTVTCATVMPIETTAFTVTGHARRETITVTNQILGRLLDPTAALLLVSLDLPDTGSPVLRGLGHSGQTYEIQATSDLGEATWTPVGLTTADGNGRFTMFEDLAAAHPANMRFYRAVAPAPAQN